LFPLPPAGEGKYKENDGGEIVRYGGGMLVLSPSKTLDFDTMPPAVAHTQPEFLAESELLIKKLRGVSPAKLSTLMDISDKLAMLNVQRYQDFSTPFSPKNARQAVLAFKGDVYEGLDVGAYDKGDFAFAQKHVRILSGLYGLLRPLDLMQAYRLEMGTRLANPRGKDLYAFWGDRITLALGEAMAESKDRLLINLASEEYFKAVRPKKLDGELLHIVFKENQKGALKIISFFAKKARGLMASYIVHNRVLKKDGLKGFEEGGYRFNPKISSDNQWIFTR
jgi:cytoplasmic iron level regulating protein YaaA (DUF328/UPF0246 family)